MFPGRIRRRLLYHLAMTNRIPTLTAVIAALLASPLSAQPSEALRAGADNMGAAFGELAVLMSGRRPAAGPADPRRAGIVARRDALPENCLNLPVVSERNGELYKNGVKIGRNAQSHKANCDGLVVWVNSFGEMHRDDKKVASRVSEYDLAWFGDAVAWKDNHGSLYRNDDDFGRVSEYRFVKHTGDVVWKNSWGELHRNREKFGRAASYAVAARTGDLAWTDNFGVLHRNDKELGRAQTWRISDRTGVVGWLNGFRDLYKNEVKLDESVGDFTMREDGKIIWVDRWGHTRSA